MTLLSTKQASEILGVDPSRVRQMILREQLPAQKMGRDWFVEEKDLALVADRKPGRPPLTGEEKAARAKKKATETGAASLPFEPPATAAKPKRRASKKAKRRSSAP